MGSGAGSGSRVSVGAEAKAVRGLSEGCLLGRKDLDFTLSERKAPGAL